MNIDLAFLNLKYQNVTTDMCKALSITLLRVSLYIQCKLIGQPEGNKVQWHVNCSLQMF